MSWIAIGYIITVLLIVAVMFVLCIRDIKRNSGYADYKPKPKTWENE